MGRHEIRLRRQRMTSRRIDNHKNFMDVLEEHERTSRTKRLVKLFLLLAFFIGLMSFLYYVIVHTGKGESEPEQRSARQTEMIYKEKLKDNTRYQTLVKINAEVRNT